MKTILALSVGLCCCVSTCYSPTSRKSNSEIAADSQSGVIRTTDFDALVGETWRGTLTYLDYSSKKLTTIRSTMRVTPAENGAWTFAVGYDDEPHADGASTLRITDSGTRIQIDDTAERVVSRTNTPTGFQFVTEQQGADDERPATIRKTYTRAADTFSIRKDVRLDGTTEFFNRHVYEWKR